MCRVLLVSRSGYYAWKQRQPSPRVQENQRLASQIEQIYQRTRQTYDSGRIHAELLADGWSISRKRVARVMQQLGVCARPKKRFRVTTDSNHHLPVAANLLERQFNAQMPDQDCVADITYIPTTKGWVYLAMIVDLFSPRVVGWSMAEV